jgi:putative Ca2+/H+ antiporter (TMEM165/GDT1 family)
VLACFPVVLVGELPDKTMFANILLATRGRPLQVWLGSSAAFAVHVAIATTAGAAVFALLPRRAVDGVVAAVFAIGAALAWRLALRGERDQLRSMPALRRAAVVSFALIFVAEWGDLTQLLIAGLSARYHSPLSVAVGSLVALCTAGAVAVAASQALLRLLNPGALRRITAVVLLGLSAYTAWLAIT